ncbi:13514_t:CDS:1 [Acaulospora morrowiae]|uniref:13514_t:CDS:1 n=1 Tax=Acaulospora morrowiae TaxID=94023 RepID=A0A9N8ZDE9_9GLOM|nr:13514_t:CDS:1 [Acaulospora morrowiae]
MYSCLEAFRRLPKRLSSLRGKSDDISKPEPVSPPLAPPDFDVEQDVGTSTETIVCLLSEADECLVNHQYEEAIEILQRATQLGCASAAAKLGVIYHGGIDASISPDYESASVYYFLALKLIYMIPCDKWDMSLLLDVIAALSEMYRFRMNRQRDSDIWNQGIKSMKTISQTLQDPVCTKFLTHRDIQKCRAIRIHIDYCLGLTAEADGDFSGALSAFQSCTRVGECGFNTADKLIKKAQSKIRKLEPQVPRVKPVCVQCGFQPKEIKDIWNLLVCSKCQAVACCSKDCLLSHSVTHAEDKKSK